MRGVGDLTYTPVGNSWLPHKGSITGRIGRKSDPPRGVSRNWSLDGFGANKADVVPRRPATIESIPGSEGQPPTYPRVAACHRGYGRDWQRVRLWHLAHHPICEDCTTAGRGPVEATEVDHVVALSAGGAHSADNLRSLCKSCHSRKTVRVDGGLGHAKERP